MSFNSDAVLTEGDVVLRSWQSRDIDPVFRACQDPQIQRFTTVPSPYRKEDAEFFVTTSQQRWSNGQPSFAIVDPKDTDVWGSIGFVGNPDPGVHEIGYWVSPWARRRGVATQALTAAARWAFRHDDVHRLVWRALVSNQGSRVVAEAAGFQMEGVLRGGLFHRGQHLDGWIAGLLRTDSIPRSR